MESGPRVASLVPVATEWIYALELDDTLVAVTSGCSVPSRATTEKPLLVRSALDGFRGTAAEIDAAVREKRDALYTLDEEVLLATRPDTLLVQTLCDACSASESHAIRAAELMPDRLHVFALSGARLDDCIEDGVAVAAAAGDAPRGRALAATLAARIGEVRRAVEGRARPRVAILEWAEPPMRCGHWYPDVVDAAGGVEVLGEAGEKSRACSWDEVRAAAPDVVVVAPCGFDIDRAAAEARRVRDKLPPGARVVAMDADRYLSRGGPSLATAVEMLAHILHPDAWPKDPDANGWREIRG